VYCTLAECKKKEICKKEKKSLLNFEEGMDFTFGWIIRWKPKYRSFSYFKLKKE